MNHTLVNEPKGKNREIEIKFGVSPENMDLVKTSHLLLSAHPWQPRHIHSTYFDTEDLRLWRKGMTLRMRRLPDGSNVMGFKSVGNDKPFSRMEVELPVSGNEPDLSTFSRSVAEGLLGVTGKKPILAQFETRIERQTGMLRQGSSEVEIALDQGIAFAGGRQVQISEVELELWSGTEVDLYDLGIRLATELPLSLQITSKAQIGFDVIAPRPRLPYKPACLAIPKRAGAEDAMAAILSDTLLHISSNWQAAAHTGNPEMLHQLRVGLRRLRSALGIFARNFSVAEYKELKSRANAVMAQLNAARDYDMMIEVVSDPQYRAVANAGSHSQLLVYLENRRAESYSRANIGIEGRDATQLVLAMSLFLARRSADRASQVRRRGGVQLAKGFASLALARLHRKAMNQVTDVSRASPKNLHKLRISLKNLRYGCQFFASLFDREEKTRAYLEILHSLQAELGRRNDVATMQRLLAEIPLSARPELHEAAGFLLGWNAGDGAKAAKRLIKLWGKFVRQKRFWD